MQTSATRQKPAAPEPQRLCGIVFDPSTGDLALVEGDRALGVTLDPATASELAGRLLRASIAQAREQGFPGVSLHVWAKNLTALGLYLRLGFVETGSARAPDHPLLRHGPTMLALSRPT